MVIEPDDSADTAPPGWRGRLVAWIVTTRDHWRVERMERRRARQGQSAEIRYLVVAARLYESQRTVERHEATIKRKTRQIDALKEQLDQIKELHHAYMRSHALGDSERFLNAVQQARDWLASGYGDFADTEGARGVHPPL
ncbi:MAG: hypothetical protein E6Q74_05305 [Pseudoxanthomonas sp.]|nr:MAG: hypothetical protein E6Q74_05305 [Pseudoxanthomonas sp.]